MSPAEIRPLIDIWIKELQTGPKPGLNYVQIFENRGLMMGCSNPHPHGQIWATSTMPNESRKEQEAFGAYKSNMGLVYCATTSVSRKPPETVLSAATNTFWRSCPSGGLAI